MKAEDNSHIKKIAAILLQRAADEFSNHGCNDLDDDILHEMRQWSAGKKQQLLRDASDWNNGDIELDDPERMGDDTLMSVVAYCLLKEIGEVA